VTRGLRLGFRLLAVLLAALSLGMSFAHVLEMPPRLRWAPELWMATTNFGGLYWLFGRVGGVIDVGAIAAAFILAYALRRERRAFRFSLSGALLLAAGLGLWAALVAPANAVMAGWVPATLPADFAAVRDRWEGGHTVVAIAKLAGFASLVLGLLLDGSLPGERR
jgi:hypothetical protein